MEAKRCNLKFFGVRELDHYHSTVPEQIIDALNSFSRRTWVPDDISRAFRLGERRQTGEPRLVIVQFHRWNDKMEILGDKRMRNLMRKEDIRVTSDLTTRQRSMVDFYKQQGKTAFYRNGKLQVVDRQPSIYRNQHQNYNSTYGRYRPSYEEDWPQYRAQAPITGSRAEDQTADKDGITTTYEQTKEDSTKNTTVTDSGTEATTEATTQISLKITGGRKEQETGRRRSTTKTTIGPDGRKLQTVDRDHQERLINKDEPWSAPTNTATTTVSPPLQNPATTPPSDHPRSPMIPPSFQETACTMRA